jgi:hypothetical protein
MKPKNPLTADILEEISYKLRFPYLVEYLKLCAPKELKKDKKAMLAWIRLVYELPVTMEDL